MGAAQIAALLSGVIVAAGVRVSNIGVAWLAKVLGVKPPEPIPEPESSIVKQTPKP